MKLRRSILSVPGNIDKMHKKAIESDVDNIMFDFEDSVSIGDKKEARKKVVAFIKNSNFKNKTVTIRINPVDTPFAYKDVIKTVEKIGDKIDAIVIPKVDSAKDIAFIDTLLDGIEAAKKIKKRIGIEASIETARGLLNVDKIVKASDRVETLVFGIADYSASIGAKLISISGHGEKEEEVYPGHRWHFALSRMVMAAKAEGLCVIDAPYGNFKDDVGLRKSATMAAAIGCDGKWAIHPNQINILNEIFSPSKEEIERAKIILKEYKKKKRGAIAIDGKMVDTATINMAKKLFEKAKLLNL